MVVSDGLRIESWLTYVYSVGEETSAMLTVGVFLDIVELVGKGCWVQFDCCSWKLEELS